MYGVAGLGFLSDAYDIFAINLASIIVGRKPVYGIELAILITATVAQLGLAVAIQVVHVLVIWGVIMGMTVQGWGNLAVLVGGLRIREVGNGGLSRRERRRERAGWRPGSLR